MLLLLGSFGHIYSGIPSLADTLGTADGLLLIKEVSSFGGGGRGKSYASLSTHETRNISDIS